MSNYLSNLAARSLNVTGALEPRSLSLFETLTVANIPNSKEGFGRERLDDISSNNQSESLEINAQFNEPKLDPPLTPLNKGGELESSLHKGKELEPSLHKGGELEPSLHRGKELEPLLNKGGEKELQNPTFLDVPQQLSNQHENIPAPSTPQPAIPITSDPDVETRKFPSLPPPVQLPSVPTVLPQQLVGEEQDIFDSRNVSVASLRASALTEVNHDILAPSLRPSEISATPSSSVTEQQSIPQHKPTIQQIFQQITSVPTLLNTESSPIQKTVLSPSAPDSSPSITPQQTYPVQPTLTTPITSDPIEILQHQSTSESQQKSSTLASIAQRIITEKIIAPVETSRSIRGETENNHHLSQMGETSTQKLLVVGRSLSNQNNNQKLITNNKQQTTNDKQPIPTIQVNIGRIEVRATPPTVTPSQKQRFAPQVMNLDEYLGQRSKGGNR